MKKGGAAKGELVLAIFELANCFRHGWGIQKDPVAAKHVSFSPYNACVSDKHGTVQSCAGVDPHLVSTMRRRQILEIAVSSTEKYDAEKTVPWI
jgi:hypothetical protein